MNEIIINGKKIKFSGKNAIINIKKDTSQKEKKIDIDDKKGILIEINGDVGNIICDSANIIVHGNAKNVLVKDGNINCDNINGKVLSTKINCNTINGDVTTFNDIYCKSYTGTPNKIVNSLKQITDIDQLKTDMIVYHKKHGNGKITYIFDNNINYRSISIRFDDTTIPNTFNFKNLITNKSLFIYDNSIINNEFEKELKKELEVGQQLSLF
jgi:hypothetical protein